MIQTERPISRILSLLPGEPARAGKGWLARCPHHEDQKASLSISEGDDGRTLLTCHAGCNTQDVLRDLGLEWPDLYPPRPPARTRLHVAGSRTYTLEELCTRQDYQAHYAYCNASGQTLFLVLRLLQLDGKKTFLQFRCVGSERYQAGLQGLQTTLYNLPQLEEAVRDGKTIFVVEGEKDVHSLLRLGLMATCNPGGAGKWRPQFTEALQKARVIILPDNDEPGERHAEAVAHSLHGKAETVRICRLPGLPKKGDVSDWLAAGGTLDELVHLAADARRWEPPTRPTLEAPASSGYHLTDWGNARRLVARHGQDLLYVDPWSRWLVWDGTRWASDHTQEVRRRAKDTVLTMYAEAAQVDDDKARKAILDHARISESQGRLKAMVESAQSEPTIPVLPDKLDTDVWLLNCQNGTLDLRTGQLLPHRRTDLITKQAPVMYDPLAGCPTWEAFLRRIMNDNTDLIGFLQRAVGYSLSGDTSQHCLFFLYGSGRNGKSTFVETVMGILGEYARGAEFSTFLEKKQDGIRNDLAELKGARFVAASEVQEGRRFAEALVKEATGGDTIKARFLYGEYFDYKPAFKIWLRANHKPVIRGTDEGIWRRIRMIPFEVIIPEEEQDCQLPVKLQAERAGILAWAVRGCLDYVERGLNPPGAVRQATEGYRAEMDLLGSFFEDCCIFDPKMRATARSLYANYQMWCQQSGEEPISQKLFGHRLAERGLERVRARTDGELGWIWRGIGLLATEL